MQSLKNLNFSNLILTSLFLYIIAVLMVCTHFCSFLKTLDLLGGWCSFNEKNLLNPVAHCVASDHMLFLVIEPFPEECPTSCLVPPATVFPTSQAPNQSLTTISLFPPSFFTRRLVWGHIIIMSATARPGEAVRSF